MSSELINSLTVIHIVVGLIFFLASIIGLIRMPDFYTRMHAAGKGDTLSSFLILFGCAIYTFHDFSFASLIVVGKIMIICFFIFTTSPTTTHALMRSGYDLGTKPWFKNEENEDDEDDDDDTVEEEDENS